MLQFHVTRLFGIKFKTHGVAIPKQGGLQLVFRDDATEPQKLLDNEIKSVLIQWDNISNIEVKHGWFGTTVEVSIVSVDRIPELPGLEDTQLELKIHRSNLHEIEPFEREVQAHRSGKVDEDVDEFIDDVRDFLDR
jgi:hypothetical protein